MPKNRSALPRSAHATAAAAAAGALVLSGGWFSPVHASVSTVPDPTAMVAGGVYALAQDGDRIIVGGLFTRMGGRVRSNMAAVQADGAVDAGFVADTDGKVAAVAVSSDGATVFLGGRFTTVNGVPRANLAAVDAATGAVLEGWQADTVGTTPNVTSLAVHADRLYVGGRYTGIDGTTRKRLVALDATTGEVITSFKPAAVGGVMEVVVSTDGSVVYAGGAIKKLGGQARSTHVGAVYASTGLATPFAPSGDGGNVVTIALSPDESKFSYTTENNTVFTYDPSAVDSRLWAVKLSGNTQAVAYSDTEVYVGGHFSQFVSPVKEARPFLGSIDPETGLPTSWNTYCAGGKMGVWALLIAGGDLHAGGLFDSFGGIKQHGYARFAATP